VAKRLKSRQKLLLIVLMLFIGILACVAAAGKWAVGPSIARRQLKASLAESWQGPVNVGKVNYNFFGPVGMREVELTAPGSSTKVTAEQIIFHMERYPTIKPVITSIDVIGLAITLSAAQGRIDLPLKLPEVPIDAAAKLQSVKITNLSVKLQGDRGVGEQLKLDEARIVKVCESVQLVLRSAGRIATANISAVRNQDRSVQVCSEGTAFGGTFEAHVNLPPETQSGGQYRASIVAKGLRLKDISRLLGHQEVTPGLVSLDLQVASPDVGLSGMTGAGTVRVDGVDPSRPTLTRAVLAVLEGPGQLPASQSRLRVVFDLAGSVATLTEGELVDQFRAMRLEKEGTVNLVTGDLDFYLATLRLEGVSNLLEAIPVVNVAAALTNKLTRVHVTGRWGDYKVSKEPVEDLSDATVGFFAELISAASGPLDPVGGLTKMLKNLSRGAGQPCTRASQPSRP